jgi:hypothetical protein
MLAMRCHIRRCVPAQTDCNPDTLPMRVEVLLNIAFAPEGPYEVNVNGVTASFDSRLTSIWYAMW